MKFYIASKLENAETVKNVSKILCAAGHEHTYDWTEHGSVQNEGEERISEVANNEYNGVKDANIVIVLLPGGRGTHAELGMAIALKKTIIICSKTDEFFTHDEKTCAFYWNYGIHRCVGEFHDWMAKIFEVTRCY